LFLGKKSWGDDLVRRIACIVLPTYNEAKNLPALLPLIFSQSGKIASHELHVLVVDDNSPDGTRNQVLEAMPLYPCLHLISGEKKGLGDAYKRGILHAIESLDPHLILQMDADFQHDPEMLPEFVRLSGEGFDLVIGSRFVEGASMPSLAWHRKLISIVGNRLVRWVGGMLPIQDCTSGFRCIKTDLILRCNLAPLSTRGYSFQSWFLCELLRNGARAVETPISFLHRLHGKSKLSIEDELEFIVNLFRLPRHAQVLPGRTWIPSNSGLELEEEPGMESARVPIYPK
jgi:dolichol-phosphate mannosyltransferase